MTFLQGHVLDVLKTLPDESVHCCITSPPYWGLRDYGLPPSVWGGDADCAHTWGTMIPGDSRGGSGTPTNKNNRGEGYGRDAERGAFCSRCGAWRGCLGLEPDLRMYVEHLVTIFREVRRVLRSDGTFWLNLGDSFSGSGKGQMGNGEHAAKHGEKQHTNKGTLVGGLPAARSNGLKPKDLCMIPARVALALQDDGWWVRSDIIWAKGISFCPTYSGSSMPESVTDRPTSSDEHVFLCTKSPRYFYDGYAVQEESVTEPGKRRNLRSVWTINPHGYREAHFATFPPKLIEPMVRAGTSEHGCCPHCGAPWKRMVKRTACSERDDTGRTHGLAEQRLSSPGAPPEKGWQSIRETVGWAPTCKCTDNTPVPCTVLDPFVGSGTTVLVATQLGRRAIGIELNPAYIRMAEERLERNATCRL